MCVCVCVHALSHVWLFAALWTAARQVPLSMEFSKQEYWSGLSSISEYLPNPGIEPASPTLAGGLFTASATWESNILY